MDEVEDVTESANERFFAISLDMLCHADFNGYFRRVNPAWERTLGFTIDELRSRPSIEFVHPDDRERTLAQNRVVKSGGRAVFFENRYLCQDVCEMSFRSYFRQHAPEFELMEPMTSLEDARYAYENMLDLLKRTPDLVGLYVAGGGITA